MLDFARLRQYSVTTMETAFNIITEQKVVTLHHQMDTERAHRFQACISL